MTSSLQSPYQPKPLHSIDDLITEGSDLTKSETKVVATLRLKVWFGLVGLSFLLGAGAVMATSWKLNQSRDQHNLEQLTLLAKAQTPQPEEIDLVKITLPANTALLVTNPIDQKLGKDTHAQDFSQIPGGVFGIEVNANNRQWVFLLPKAMVGLYRLYLVSDEAIEGTLHISLQHNGKKFDLFENITTDTRRLYREFKLAGEIENSVITTSPQ